MNIIKSKLYNVIFPLWIVMFVPPYLFIILISNLIIDGVVIYATLQLNKLQINWRRLKIIILKAWGFGFVADLAGVFLLILFAEGGINTYSPWRDGLSFLLFLFVVAIAGLIIFMYNYWLFQQEGYSKTVSFRVGLAMGIITAPWVFLLPPSLFY